MRIITACLFVVLGLAPSLFADEAEEKLIKELNNANPDEKTIIFTLQDETPNHKVFGLILGKQKVTPEVMKSIVGFKNLIVLGLGISGESIVEPESLKLLSQFPKLEKIQIAAPCLTDEHIKILADAKRLHQLWVIQEKRDRRAYTFLEDQKDRVMLGYRFRPKNSEEVEDLYLTDTKITATGFKHFAQFKNLTELKLRGLKIDDEIVKQISQYSKLEKLDLSGTTVTGQQLKTLRGLKKLTHLELNQTNLSDADLKELIGYPALKNLGLAEIKMTDQGLESLGQIVTLEEINLQGNNLSPKAFKHLEKLTNLSTVELLPEHKTDELVTMLSQIGKLHSICTVYRNQTRKEGEPHIYECELFLSKTKITDTGLREFVKLPGLQRIYTDRDRITDEFLEVLIDADKLHLILNRGSDPGEIYRKNGGWHVGLWGERLSKKLLPKLAKLKKLNSLFLMDKEFSGQCFADVAKLGIKELELRNLETTDEEFQQLAKLDLKKIRLIKIEITPSILKSIGQMPNLESVHFFDCPFDEKNFKELGNLKKLSDLRIESKQIDDVALRSLRKTGLLHKVESLKYSFSPELSKDQNITILNLSKTAISDAGLLELTELTKLEYLTLSETTITDEGVRYLTRLKSLKGFDLSKTAIEGSSLNWVARMPNLTILQLSNTRIQDEHLELLSKNETLQNLYLSDTLITHRGLKHLVNLKDIRFIEISPDMVTNEVMEVLSKHPKAFIALASGLGNRYRHENPKDGEYLKLSRTRVTNEGLKYLVGMPNLKILDLSETAITGEGLSHLVGCKELSILNLEKTQIQSADLMHLTKCPKLAYLNLDKTRIDNDAVQHLLKMPNLKTLHIEAKAISKEDLKKLREKRPDLSIQLHSGPD